MSFKGKAHCKAVHIYIESKSWTVHDVNSLDVVIDTGKWVVCDSKSEVHNGVYQYTG